MTRPSVAIVGRPNVGKSSLLNALAGARISIVDPTPGVTRDRIGADIRHAERCFELVDTGGSGIVDRHDLESHVEMQINAAVAGADLVLFTVDAQDGLTPLDRRAAEALRRSGKETILVANKVDDERFEGFLGEFHKLGSGEPVCISAKFNIGLAELLDVIVEHLPERRDDEDLHATDDLKIAIVGQRNAGKSTLLNAILGEDRVIVSDVPGTTRDSVDVRVERDGRAFVVIDTAGVRKANRLADSIEFYSQVRSREAVERCQVAVFLIDAGKEVSQVDKEVADWILERRRACVLAINKWDLAEASGVDTDAYLKYLETRLPLLHYAPVVFLSAKERTRVEEIVDVAFDLHRQSGTRISTADVNKVLRKAFEVRKPSRYEGKSGKLFYGTQVGTHPPWFVIFVNEPKLFRDDYRRYLENRLREAFGFSEVPLRISFRARAPMELE